MLKTQLLEKKISESGKKRGYLAEKCGISRQSFYMKTKGLTEFTPSEINILCGELKITRSSEKDEIFLS